MIWFFLALVLGAIILSQVLKKEQANARFAQAQQNSVRMSNRFNNQKISNSIRTYSVPTLFSMIEEAKQQAALKGGTFTLAPDVERSLQAKIAQEEEKTRLDAQLAAAICSVAAREAQDETAPASDADEADDSFQATLRSTAETGLQTKALQHLEQLKALADEARQRARNVLLAAVQNKGGALPTGAAVQAKTDLPLPDWFREKELHDLMRFIGFQVEGYDLIDPFDGSTLVWRHRDLLDLYLSLIQKACEADGIHVSYEAQIQDGWDGVPKSVSLPYHVSEKPRHRIVPKVCLCISCKT